MGSIAAGPTPTGPSEMQLGKTAQSASVLRGGAGARPALLIVAALALVGHLLGPHAEHGPLADGTLSAMTLGVVSADGEPAHRAADEHGDHDGLETPSPSGHEDDAPCGYLLQQHGGDGPDAQPVPLKTTVPAPGPEPAADVRPCPVGERAPPDLVHELQVIRI